MTDKEKIGHLLEVLARYADPESYHAIAWRADRPAGWFADDFNEDEWVKDCGYNRPMPGAAARRSLSLIKD